MNQKEVVDTLLYQAKIEPGFTELVWQKLEEENREFFKAYNVRLLLKNQILVFNKLLEKQVELMQKVCPPGVDSVPLSNGSSSSTLQQTPYYISRPGNMFCNGGSTNAMLNGASSGIQSIPAANDAFILGINGSAIKSEPSYSSNSDFNICTDSSFLEVRPSLGVEPGASFSSSELNGQPLTESLLDIDSSPFGFLSQIPRNFSFSDLTDGFTPSSDILENYGRSPFLGHVANNFSDSPGRDCNEEDGRLDTISEDLSYDDFGSD